MRWEMTDEHQALQLSFRAWLERYAPPPSAAKWFEEADEGPFEERLTADGWDTVGLPEDRGGQGGGLVELAILAEEMGRAGVPSSAWLANCVAAPAVEALAGGSSRVVGPGIGAASSLTGEHHDHAGGVALAVDCHAPPDAAGEVVVDDSGRLFGRMARVLGADRANTLVVPARASEGVGLYVVDTDATGVVFRRRQFLDRARSVADVGFTGVAGEPMTADAAAVLRNVTLRAAILVAADSLGASQHMLDLAVGYSLQRYQFGVPIGSFQAVKHAAATMLVAVEAARSIVYFAAASTDQGLDDAPLHAAVAKAQVGPAGEKVADLALAVHGAIGYTWEYELQRFYKRAKLDAALFGRAPAWNEQLAQALLGGNAAT